MYCSFFGLRESPFTLAPDPRFLLLSVAHREALAALQHGLAARQGLTLLTGAAGTGKTTLLRAAVVSFGERADRMALLDNPGLTRDEFFELAAALLRLSDRAAVSKAAFLLELAAALDEGGGVRALVVDEAQAAPAEILEELRLLSNLESPGGRRLAIVLAGQPELGERLEAPGLRPLKQRIALRCALRPLDPPETAEYVTCRARMAGASTGLFLPDVLRLVHDYSAGIPRAINAICENALAVARERREATVGAAAVLEACRRLALLPPLVAIEPTPLHVGHG